MGGWNHVAAILLANFQVSRKSENEFADEQSLWHLATSKTAFYFYFFWYTVNVTDRKRKQFSLDCYQFFPSFNCYANRLEGISFFILRFSADLGRPSSIGVPEKLLYSILHLTLNELLVVKFLPNFFLINV